MMLNAIKYFYCYYFQNENGFDCNNVGNSASDVQSQETMEGGLLIACTEEDEEDGEDSEITGECNSGTSGELSANFSGFSSVKSSGSEKKMLVNYEDSDEEKEGQEQKPTPMDVDTTLPAKPLLPLPALTPIVDEGKRNTMAFLKTKRIERHSTRGNDTTPLKKIKTCQTQSSDR